MKLDYSLTDSHDRIDCVNQLLTETSPNEINKNYLQYMSDYILCTSRKNQTKEERKVERPILTKNREATVSKRQVSFEEIVSKLENGEDGLYALLASDNNQKLDRKELLSEKDYEEIPILKEYLKQIHQLQRAFEKAPKEKRYGLKKQIIETWQQMYMVRTSARGGQIRGAASQAKSMIKLNLDENITFDENQMPVSDGVISLFNPTHVSFLLCYYSVLKQESQEEIQSDMFHLLLDLENLVERALQPYPMLYDLLIWKIDGLENAEIQYLMTRNYGVSHTEQYYSTLWRKRIPKIIAECAQKEYIVWYYFNEEYGQWKKCNRCGEVKLAHPLFFSKNSSSRDGYYSICKECRNNKNKN